MERCLSLSGLNQRRFCSSRTWSGWGVLCLFFLRFSNRKARVSFWLWGSAILLSCLWCFFFPQKWSSLPSCPAVSSRGLVAHPCSERGLHARGTLSLVWRVWSTLLLFRPWFRGGWWITAMGCCRGLEDTRRFSANGLHFSGDNNECFFFSFFLLLVVFIPLLSPVVSECLGNAQMFTGLICWQWLVDPSSSNVPNVLGSCLKLNLVFA